jgi:hypothetical protein
MTARRGKLTAKRVRELLDCDPSTGILTWRERAGLKSFNTRLAGMAMWDATFGKFTRSQAGATLREALFQPGAFERMAKGWRTNQDAMSATSALEEVMMHLPRGYQVAPVVNAVTPAPQIGPDTGPNTQAMGMQPASKNHRPRCLRAVPSRPFCRVREPSRSLGRAQGPNNRSDERRPGPPRLKRVTYQG